MSKTEILCGNDRKKAIYERELELRDCQTCVYNLDTPLVFHHLDPDEKVDGVAQMVHQGYTIEELKEEMEKCVVLCKKCHTKYHHLNDDLEVDSLPSKGGAGEKGNV